MAKQLTVDELKEELLKWQETRDFLNREIAAVEQSTTAVSVWMAETKDHMCRSYFSLSDALRRRDSADFEKALDAAGELAGTVLKIPLNDGKTITEAAEKAFGGKNASAEDKRVYARLSAVVLEFPEHLYTPVETQETVVLPDGTETPRWAAEGVAKAAGASLDEIAEAAAKTKLEAEKEEKAEKSSWASKMWPFGSTQKEKPADVVAKIQEVRGELLGLKTSKPFYVNSFFDWLESMHLPPEGRPEVLGEGDYTDYLTRTYRNPDYLLRQVYNDCNETLQVIFEDVCENAQAYDALKAVFTDQDLDGLGAAITRYKDNKEIVKNLLAETGEPSLAALALSAFDAGEKRTKAFAAAIEAAPEHLTVKDKDGHTLADGKNVFDRVFELVLEKEASLTPDALAHTYAALQRRGQDKELSAVALAVLEGISEETEISAAEKELWQKVLKEARSAETAQMLFEEKKKEYLKNTHSVDFETQSFPHSSKLTKTLAETADAPEKTKAVLHALFQVMGRDTAAVDFYVDMRQAITEGKAQKTGNLLKNASRETLEEWLLIRTACEPEAGHAMDALLDVAKTEDARARLFATAVAAGVPPFAPEADNAKKLHVMKTRLHDLLNKALPTAGTSDAKQADIEIYKATTGFVIANTTQAEFAEMVSSRQNGAMPLLAKIMTHVYGDPDDRAAYLSPVYDGFAQNIEFVAALLAAKETAGHHTPKLAAEADIFTGAYIQSPAGETASVLYPEKLSHIYHAYDAVGYFSGAKSGQSDAAISKENAATYINVLEKRPGYIRIGDDLLRAENWDMMIYNSQYGDLEVFKNGTDKISLSLEEARVDEVFKAAKDGKDSFVAFQDMLLLDAATFTTVRYNEAAGEVVFDQDILVSDVTKAEFDALAQALQNKNSGVYSVADENLLINTNKVDGVYTRKLSYYDPDAPSGEKEWEESTVELLINGRTLFTKDLLGERDYDLDTDISAQERKDAALSEKIAADIAARANFKNVADGLTVNKNTVLAVRSAEDTGMDTLTVLGGSRYILEYLQDTAGETAVPAAKDDGIAKAFNAAVGGHKSAAAQQPQIAKKSVNWVNADRILKEPFIEVKSGHFEVVVHGEEISLKAAQQHRAAVDRTHTEVFDDFLVNKDDLCEVSIYRGDSPRVVLKTGSEDVSVDVNAGDVKNAAKSLGLQNTVLTAETPAGERGKLQQAAVLNFYRSDKKRSVGEVLQALETKAPETKAPETKAAAQKPSGNQGWR